MSELTLCVAFGNAAHPAVWASTLDVENVPGLGMRTQVHLTLSNGEDDPDEGVEVDEDDDSVLIAEVAHLDVNEDGTPVAYLYASDDLPSETTISLLEQADWVRLNDDVARGVLAIVEASPPAAATHDVLLVLGDPDPSEGPAAVEAWSRSFHPDDPRVPMFGDRLLIDPLDAMGDYTDLNDSYLDITLEIGVPDDDNADSDESDTDSDDEEVVAYNRLIDLDEPGSLDDGFPGLVFYAAKVDAGEAQVGFWLPRPEGINGFELLAAGWQRMNADEFDPVEFRLSERINLATRTVIRVEEDEDGDIRLADYEIDDAETVEDDQLELLPPALSEHCRASREFTDIESIIDSWRNPDEDR